MNYESKLYDGRNAALTAGSCESQSPKRDPEIFTELQRLEKSIEYCADRLQTLQQRLALVTRQEPAVPLEKNKSGEPQTAFGQRIREAQDKVDRISDSISTQLRTLEL